MQTMGAEKFGQNTRSYWVFYDERVPSPDSFIRHQEIAALRRYAYFHFSTGPFQRLMLATDQIGKNLHMENKKTVFKETRFGEISNPFKNIYHRFG